MPSITALAEDVAVEWTEDQPVFRKALEHIVGSGFLLDSIREIQAQGGSELRAAPSVPSHNEIVECYFALRKNPFFEREGRDPSYLVSMGFNRFPYQVEAIGEIYVGKLPQA